MAEDVDDKLIDSGTKPQENKTEHISNQPISKMLDYNSYTSMPSYTNGMDAIQMPYYLDVYGNKHVNYSHTYGPHAGKSCNCDECSSFNKEVQNREQMYERRMKIFDDAREVVSRYHGGSIYRERNFEPYSVLHLMQDFAMKHVAALQEEMMEKVHKIQLEHTAHLSRVMSQQNQMSKDRERRDLEKLRAGESDGRMFRVGEESV